MSKSVNKLWVKLRYQWPLFLTDRLKVPSVSAHLSTLTCSQTIQGRKDPQCIPQLHVGDFQQLYKGQTEAQCIHQLDIMMMSIFGLKANKLRAKRQQSVTKWMVLRECNVTFEMLNTCHVKVAAPSMKTTFDVILWCFKC